MSGDYLPLRPMETPDGEDVRYAMLDAIGVEDDAEAADTRGINEVSYWLARYRSAFRVEHDPLSGVHDTPRLPAAMILIKLPWSASQGPEVPLVRGSYSLDGYDLTQIAVADHPADGEVTVELASYHGGIAVTSDPRAHVTVWDGQVAHISIVQWLAGAGGTITLADATFALLVYR